MRNLDDRVAVVTGCGKRDGLGAAIARALSAAGAHVLVSDVVDGGVSNDVDTPVVAGSTEGVSALARELSMSSVAAAAALADLREEADCSRLVDTAVGLWGRLDILVSNAAAPHGRERSPIADVPLAAWDLQLDVNLRGAFLLARAAVPAMRRGGRGGRILVVSSIAASRGLPHRVVYSASKAGLLGLVCSLATELGPDGITVNAICPGLISTSRGRSSAIRQSGEASADEELRRRARVIPAGRMGHPDDIAEVVRFLAGDAASYVTGQAIAVDGGLSALLPIA
jgi:NAD(P)-dependent dehydrogenase (short-subunit alcohol dehydrogenase family)